MSGTRYGDKRCDRCGFFTRRHKIPNDRKEYVNATDHIKTHIYLCDRCMGERMMESFRSEHLEPILRRGGA